MNARLVKSCVSAGCVCRRRSILNLLSLTLALLVSTASLGQEPKAQPTDGDRKSFELTVVDPGDHPVAGAVVEIRMRPKPTAEWVQHGQYGRQATYGAFLRTAADGRIVLSLPAATRRLNVSIKTDGFGPYWSGWDGTPTGGDLPDSFTAHLDAGRSVGGRVVDPRGNPIEGASVRVSMAYKKRPGDTSALHVGREFKTDPEGKWACRFVPASMRAVAVEITHPQYQPTRKSLSLDQYGIESDQDGSQPITMKQGLVVTGRVTGPNGKPVAGALVRTKFFNDVRETRTDSDGIYRLGGCEPVMSKIVVSADSLAVDMKELRISAESPPVDFDMKPGGHVRVRVLDEQGEPIPKTRIFFQGWRSSRYEYFEFDHVHQYTDKQGIWQWDEAPEDAFEVDICRPGGMTMTEQSLLARDEEYVFKPPQLLVIRGTVVDAETGQPIESFRVVPGIRSSPSHMNWVQDGRDGAFQATGGKFKFTRNRGYLAHLARIEAPGYLPTVSREIGSDEGTVSLKFELRRGHDVAATVLAPEGQPAVGAKIALGLPGSQISIQDGSIDDSSTYAARTDTDAEGQFSFPPQGGNYQLVITHSSGYAHIKADAEDRRQAIRLTPWGRVEGTFRVAGEPVAGVTLTLSTNAIHSSGRDVPNIFAHYDTSSGREGRFVFDKVCAGKGWINRQILMMVSDGAQEVTSAAVKPIDVTEAETTQVEFGRGGRGVVGTLVPPAGTPLDAVWSFTLINVESRIPAPGDPPYAGDPRADPKAYQMWFQQWTQTEAGKHYLNLVAEYEKAERNAPRFRASVDVDGSFRIDDVPAGDYTLSFSGRGGQHPQAVAGLVRHDFEVPEATGDLNLGPLLLE
jgi:protocatechuate 3,4-dioxygenase beta subunit